MILNKSNLALAKVHDIGIIEFINSVNPIFDDGIYRLVAYRKRALL